MKSPTPCLMTGPYDFAEEAVPRGEFDARIALVREVMRARGVGRLAVHGNAFDHAALAWLTNFTPKLGPAFALMALKGPLKMLFAGGPGMAASAKRLTFVEDMTPARGGADVGAWLAEGVANGDKPALVEGAALTQETWRGIVSALAAPPRSLDTDIDPLRRWKSRAERALIARAVDMLAATMSMATLFAGEEKRRGCMVATESAAYGFGAQDARVLLSRRAFGPPEPLSDHREAIAAPAQLALALRHRGYWATGRTMLGGAPKAALKSARDTLEAAAAALRAGTAAAFTPASRSIDVRIHGVGLGVEEAPRGGEKLVEGEVVNIIVSTRGAKACAFSAMALVEARRARLLWASPELEIKIARVPPVSAAG